MGTRTVYQAPAMGADDWQLWMNRMRHLLMDKGLLGGHSEYMRFIIVGRSRTGSNLLRSLLNAHSQVESYGEVFRSPAREAMDWDHTGVLRQSDRMHRLLLEDPVSFIGTRIYRRYPAGIAAVGFKIFYYHAQEGNWQAVWPALQQQTGIRVIHMKRRNMLSTHLSRQRAELTDVWVNTSGQVEQPLAIHLDYEQCLADFQRTRAWEEACDAQFAGHAKMRAVLRRSGPGQRPGDAPGADLPGRGLPAGDAHDLQANAADVGPGHCQLRRVKGPLRRFALGCFLRGVRWIFPGPTSNWSGNAP
ncbi:MAG: hypothetical protein V9H69_23390 [Anaerolineae bacterium]